MITNTEYAYCLHIGVVSRAKAYLLLSPWKGNKAGTEPLVTVSHNHVTNNFGQSSLPIKKGYKLCSPDPPDHVGDPGVSTTVIGRACSPADCKINMPRKSLTLSRIVSHRVKLHGTTMK
jgi:hypothetical protein